MMLIYIYFFFNDTATSEIYTYCHTLALHDALPSFISENIKIGSIVTGGHIFLCNGHSYTIGKALPQGTCGNFDSGQKPVFRMARRLAMQLPKIFNIIHPNIIAGEI